MRKEARCELEVTYFSNPLECQISALPGNFGPFDSDTGEQTMGVGGLRKFTINLDRFIELEPPSLAA